MPVFNQPHRPPADHEANTLSQLMACQWFSRFDDSGEPVPPQAREALVRLRRNVEHECKFAVGAEYVFRIRWEDTSLILRHLWEKKMRDRLAAAVGKAESLAKQGARFLSFVVAPSCDYQALSAAEIDAVFAASVAARSRINGEKRGKNVRQYLPDGAELVLAADHVAALASGWTRPHTHLVFADFGGRADVLEYVEAALNRLGLTVQRSDGLGPTLLKASHVELHLTYLHGYPLSVYRSTGEKIEDLAQAFLFGEVEALDLLPAFFGLVGDTGRMRQCVRCYGSFSARSHSTRSKVLEGTDCVSPAAPSPEAAAGGVVTPEELPETSTEILPTGKSIPREPEPPRTRILVEYQEDHPKFSWIKVTKAVIEWRESSPPTRENIEAVFWRLGAIWATERAAIAAARAAATKPLEVWYSEMEAA